MRMLDQMYDSSSNKIVHSLSIGDAVKVQTNGISRLVLPLQGTQIDIVELSILGKFLEPVES